MAKYIDADKLKRHYAWWGTSDNPFLKQNKQDFDQIIDLQPAADVVEVVRCKTCYHYKPREYGYNCTLMDWDAREEDYCSRWEKKDG